MAEEEHDALPVRERHDRRPHVLALVVLPIRRSLMRRRLELRLPAPLLG
jgi:hypothetical protein